MHKFLTKWVQNPSVQAESENMSQSFRSSFVSHFCRLVRLCYRFLKTISSDFSTHINRFPSTNRWSDLYCNFTNVHDTDLYFELDAGLLSSFLSHHYFFQENRNKVSNFSLMTIFIEQSHARKTQTV